MIPVNKPILGEEEISAVAQVLRSGNLAQGERVAEFEREFAKYCGVKHAVAFSSGTSAIHTGVVCAGIGKGDEVVTTPFTFVATANPVLFEGGKVVFADINEDTFCIDPEQVRISRHTKLLIPVDLFGQLCDYEPLYELGIPILEDACQAVGATKDGVKAGNFGNMSAFSFYATKNMTTGEGGMLTTNRDMTADIARMFRHHGQDGVNGYDYFMVGNNYRMTDISASIGIEQLKKVDDFNRQRQLNAQVLNEGLKDIEGIVTPKLGEGNSHVYHQYTIRITDEYWRSREDTIQLLKRNGIGSGVYYPRPLHLFKQFGYSYGDFPVAERVSKQVLSLPVNPLVGESTLLRIVELLHTKE